MTQQRTASGIPGLDEILEGGLIPQRTYLLVGPAGSGKTVFSFQ
jgi:KaiC/GvpD/RAD55 family RecA-like ATPase